MGDYPNITFTMTAGRRLNLFRRTMDSFIENCLDTDLIVRWVCCDDRSGDYEFNLMKKEYPFMQFCKAGNHGQAASLNKVFSLVETEWFIHWEDDWLTTQKAHFIREAFDIARQDDRLKNIIYRYWDCPSVTKDNLKYRVHVHNYDCTDESTIKADMKWYGFSLNPGLNHKPTIDKLGAYDETGFGLDGQRARFWDRAAAVMYREMGLLRANTETPYVEHIGDSESAYAIEWEKPVLHVTQDTGLKESQVVALCKTFAGEEFVESMLDSIYDYMGGIVFVHSDVSWGGERGNTVLPVVEKWCETNDHINRVVNLTGEWTNQNDQYNYGLRFLRDRYPSHTHVLIIDTDEVWDGDQLKKLIDIAIKHGNKYDTYRPKLHGYVKTPFYRIDRDPCQPVSMISRNVESFKAPRGCSISNQLLIDDVFFHHFTLVRKDLDTVIKKMNTSSIGDRHKKGNVDPEIWIESKWDKMPFANNFHYQSGLAHVWNAIKRITFKDLPKVLKDKEFMETFIPKDTYFIDEILDKYLEDGIPKGKSAVIGGNGREAVLLSLLTDNVIVSHLHDSFDKYYKWYLNIEEVPTGGDIVNCLQYANNLNVLFITTEDVGIMHQCVKCLAPRGLLVIRTANNINIPKTQKIRTNYTDFQIFRGQ